MSHDQPTQPGPAVKRTWDRWLPMVLILGFNLLAYIAAWLANGLQRPGVTVVLFEQMVQAVPPPLSIVFQVLLTLVSFFIDGRHLRYVLIANGLALVPLFFAAGYLRRLYRMDSFSTAFSYLTEVMFSDTSRLTEELALPANYRDGHSGLRIALIEGGKLVPAGNQERNRVLLWAGGPGYVVVPAHHAAQIMYRGRFTRVEGPGLVGLERFERVFQVVDLRQVVRQREFTALTRDGVPVTVQISVHCRIRQAQRPTQDRPFPFARQAIRNTVLNGTVSASGPVPWTERAIGSAGSALNQVLARYRLDELFEPLDLEADPRVTIQEEVRRILNHSAPSLGVDITDVQLGSFQLPPEVQDQYLDNWRAGWQSQDMAKLAEGDVAEIEIMEMARAEALQRVIETLVQAFRSAQASRPRRRSSAGGGVAAY